MIIRSLTFAIFAFVSIGAALAQDWNQWRGGKLDSVAADQTVVDQLSADTQLWRTELPGPAGSSPIVVGDRVFLTSVEGDDLVVLGVDANSGDVLWKQSVAGKNQNSRDGGNSASSSPCSDGEHVWTMFGNGQVDCFKVDGERVWEKNLQEEYGEFQIQFGMSTTPVLHEGQLIFGLMHGKMRNDTSTSVGKIVSLDAATGNEKWLHLRKTDAVAENKHVYASPAIDHSGDAAQLVIHGADYTTGHSMVDGSEIWRMGGMNPKGDGYNPYLRFVASPVCHDGIVVVPTAKRGPVLAFPVSQQGTVEQNSLAWTSERITPDVASPVVYAGYVFLARENGALACLDAKDGTKRIEKRYMADKHRSTPVAVDGKLVITGRDGRVYLVKADPTLEKLSEIDLAEETLSSAAVAKGKIFVRTFDALYAFGKEPVAATAESKFAIAIHGGAGSSKESMNAEAAMVREAAMKEALEIGKQILAKGGTSIEAVEKVIVFLENDPGFNAGKGAVLNAVGTHELDASIMDGKGRQCGAVAGVTTVKNPIRLARRVMTDTKHVLLAGQGAEAFADSLGKEIGRVSNDYFTTDKQRARLERIKKRTPLNSGSYTPMTNAEKRELMGTVGCVALDQHGNLAAGTSTGGMSGKKFGRVGDSPIVGAGTYADNKTCAVSGTGIGEQYIRNAVAYNVAAQMQYGGATLQQSLDDNLKNRLEKNDGGLIAVDRDGVIATGTNTGGMLRGIADSAGRFEVSW